MLHLALLSVLQDIVRLYWRIHHFERLELKSYYAVPELSFVLLAEYNQATNNSGEAHELDEKRTFCLLPV